MKWTRTFFPLLFSVTVMVALTWCLWSMNNMVHPSHWTGGKSTPWEEFFSVFGMVYAILSGFLLVDVLNRFNKLSETMEDELNAVEDIRDFLLYIDGGQDETIHRIKKELYEYVYSVSQREWERMQRLTKLSSDTSKELYDVMKAVNQIQVTNESDRIALQSLIQKLSNVTNFRTKRICLARQKLPTRLKLLLLFISVMLVTFFLLMGAGTMWMHMMMVGSITVSVHLLYMIISDLDYPFQGIWQIDKTPLDELVRNLEREFKASS